MSVRTDTLTLSISAFMSDGKYHTVDELKEVYGCSTIEIKEALLSLLKGKQVQYAGSRWRLIPQSTFKTQGQPLPGLFVRCPECKHHLEVLEEYIKMKVECPYCSTKFYISSRKCATNEFEAISAKDVYHE